MIRGVHESTIRRYMRPFETEPEYLWRHQLEEMLVPPALSRPVRIVTGRNVASG